MNVRLAVTYLQFVIQVFWFSHLLHGLDLGPIFGVNRFLFCFSSFYYFLADGVSVSAYSMGCLHVCECLYDVVAKCFNRST